MSYHFKVSKIISINGFKLAVNESSGDGDQDGDQLNVEGGSKRRFKIHIRASATQKLREIRARQLRGKRRIEIARRAGTAEICLGQLRAAIDTVSQGLADQFLDGFFDAGLGRGEQSGEREEGLLAAARRLGRVERGPEEEEEPVALVLGHEGEMSDDVVESRESEKGEVRVDVGRHDQLQDRQQLSPRDLLHLERRKPPSGRLLVVVIVNPLVVLFDPPQRSLQRHPVLPPLVAAPRRRPFLLALGSPVQLSEFNSK